VVGSYFIVLTTVAKRLAHRFAFGMYRVQIPGQPEFFSGVFLHLHVSTDSHIKDEANAGSVVPTHPLSTTYHRVIMGKVGMEGDRLHVFKF
jgi:ATP-dependent Lon protease